MLKARIIPVASDDQGMMSTRLAEIMEKWDTDPETASLPRPKCLYTTPTGANPAGTTASDDRKRQILALARQHNFLVLEDDPYYYLHFEGLDQDAVTRPRCRSYWSLEEEHRDRWGTGRVIRFESFSKILAAGLRLDSLREPNEILDGRRRQHRHVEPPTFGSRRAVAFTLLNHWGHPRLPEARRQRRSLLCEA